MLIWRMWSQRVNGKGRKIRYRESPVDVFVEGQGGRRWDSIAPTASLYGLMELRAVRLGTQQLETDFTICFTNLLIVALMRGSSR